MTGLFLDSAQSLWYFSAGYFTAVYTAVTLGYAPTAWSIRLASKMEELSVAPVPSRILNTQKFTEYETITVGQLSTAEGDKMKKMAVIFLVMLLNLNLAYADENKLDIFAKSPLVSGLVVKRDNSKLLYEYTMQSESFKGDFGPDTLADANFRYVFKTNRSLIIKYQGFNPLEVAVKLESKDEKQT